MTTTTSTTGDHPDMTTWTDSELAEFLNEWQTRGPWRLTVTEANRAMATLAHQREQLDYLTRWPDAEPPRLADGTIDVRMLCRQLDAEANAGLGTYAAALVQQGPA
jgi:hypothetical protein